MIDGLQALCPDGKVRRVALYRRGITTTTEQLDLVPCSVKLSNQIVRGWKDLDSGRFIPDNYSSGYVFLDGLGVLPAAWKEASENVHTLERKAAVARSKWHRMEDCVVPPLPDGYPPELAEEVRKSFTAMPSPTLALVHGLKGHDGVFRPIESCPNYPLWPAD